MPEATLTPSPNEARERHQEAITAQQEARGTSEQARATLAALEAAADRGEEVSTEDYNRAKADLSLKSRRKAALAGQVTEAEEAVSAAQKAVDDANLRELALTIPDSSKARTKLERAFTEYLTAMQAEDDAVLAVYQVADRLPNLSGASTEDGWPCHDPGLNHRVGFLRLDGKPIKRPNITREVEHLALDLPRQAHIHGR